MDKSDYKFQNIVLYRKAMTHSSYANEHRERHLQHNERLEFLGDSVLGFVTADYLFNHYPELPEGELTKLRAAVVCEQTLCEIAKELGIDKEIRLGHGEETGGGRQRPSILADATEALLGAIYLDGGIEPARKFVLDFVPRKAEEARHGGVFKDYKTMLQEIVQKSKQETLEYRLAGESGPDHDKQFTMEVLLNSNVFATGTGRSKKEAEQMAAKQALALMGQ
ncbi:ribonuclease III [Intestinibacillus massiliensis]|uniref:ribonuclease III n=1 Tax=Intestinibacillus massiliensis TaxID=1871029 RepID=UPI000B35C427|nr:ribonuclease III [Intestinibacillus massiliensis]MCB6366426.1 ribonuclease III [Intestinibacillus massiliensis]